MIYHKSLGLHNGKYLFQEQAYWYMSGFKETMMSVMLTKTKEKMKHQGGNQKPKMIFNNFNGCRFLHHWRNWNVSGFLIEFPRKYQKKRNRRFLSLTAKLLKDPNLFSQKLRTLRWHLTFKVCGCYWNGIIYELSSSLLSCI